MTFVDFLAQFPDWYWFLVYFSWGGVYAAITVSLVVVTALSSRWARARQKPRWKVFLVQTVWAMIHLPAVFLVPWLVGAFAADTLKTSEFMPAMLGSWVVGAGAAYWLARPFWDIAELRAWPDWGKAGDGKP